MAARLAAASIGWQPDRESLQIAVVTYPDPATPSYRVSRWLRFGLSLSLFLVVLGANWAAFDRYGSDIPDWDQWDAEDVQLILPWFQHDHFVAHLFQPQNEHRVLLTKLQNLATVIAAGQWDVRVECLFNAVLHAFIAVGLWCLARRWLAKPWLPIAYLVIAALYALPLSAQNLLGGFDSQQYWLVGLSLATIALLPWARPWGAAWWLGTLAAVLALGSMASGFFAAGVVFGLVVWRWLGREIGWGKAWPTLALTAALIAVGFATRIVVGYHEPFKAHSLVEFCLYVVRSLEWPFYWHDWAGILIWSPWVALTAMAVKELWLSVRHRTAAQPADASAIRLGLMGLGLWVILQLLATAYARGSGANYPASRYLDTLMFGAAVNALTVGWFLTRLSARRRAAGGGPILSAVLVHGWALAWTVSFGTGLGWLVWNNLHGEFPNTKAYYVGCEAHVRAYLATNDVTELTDPIPYLNVPWLVQRLSAPSIRAVMPSSVRPPLPFMAAQASGFLENHASERRLDTAPRAGLSPRTPALAAWPTWGSYDGAGLANRANWRSEPLRAPLHGWLRFETAGDVGKPGIRLELHDVATDRVLASVCPTKLPGDTWRTAYARAPAQPFVVVAEDAAPDRWVAFSAPVEMSTLSYWAWQLTKNGRLLAEFAGAAALMLGVGSLLVGRVVPAKPRNESLTEAAA